MTPVRTEIKLRLLLGETILLGPGKADLLDAIVAAGSISGAARRMGMSYKRAWDLVSAMNTAYREPLVDTSAGGRGGGGAAVTVLGREILERYRRMQAAAATAIAPELAELARDIARSPSRRHS